MKQTKEDIEKLYISPTTWLSKFKHQHKDVEFLLTKLTEEEKVLLCFNGIDCEEDEKLETITKHQKLGIVFITNNRVIHGSTGKLRETFNEIKLLKDTSVMGQGFPFFSGWIGIKNNNHEMWLGNMTGGKKQVTKILEVLNEVISNLSNESGSDQKPTQSSDNIDKIKKLKELLDMGVLNQQEFDDKKNELLKDI